MDEFEAKNDEIVYIPVPLRLLPAFYRALAVVIAEESRDEGSASSTAAMGAAKQNLIDLIVKVAYGIGADRHAVSLPELYNAYLRAYPGIGKGTTRGSFDATVNYHCVNMRSRFPDANNRRKSAYWLTRPAFKRTARARYMLLSPDELGWFRRCIEENHPLIYEDEYEVADLARCDDQEKEDSQHGL